MNQKHDEKGNISLRLADAHDGKNNNLAKLKLVKCNHTPFRDAYVSFCSS